MQGVGGGRVKFDAGERRQESLGRYCLNYAAFRRLCILATLNSSWFSAYMASKGSGGESLLLAVTRARPTAD